MVVGTLRSPTVVQLQDRYDEICETPKSQQQGPQNQTGGAIKSLLQPAVYCSRRYYVETALQNMLACKM